MNETYFFDTYAIIEILKGNLNYKKYVESKSIISVFNLTELHLQITREFGEELASKILEEYSSCVIDFNLEDIKETTNMKIKYAKRRMSIPDVVGYIIAKRLGIKFLTGDEQFKDLENVEFVK
jgi:hypothetical protein